ncbi:PilE-like protein [Elusimicrobium minutum Pei191]|uniref:PilE-like protein n=1 Tax=Elusimicrobium minutum (strain Pei191) TaxID=445932 RepID=B2KC10_ELUMP|nr:PilE-like protein [Elusimicrobium minutum]ACC98137.1 PilE-like protein [Elusimicrobium minutum Pei191]
MGKITNILNKKITPLNGSSGFTMMELLVIFILVAVLAQIAIVAYRRSVEDAKLDRAKAIFEEVMLGHQKFMIDNPSARLNSGPLNLVTKGSCDLGNRYTGFGGTIFSPNVLINCGYVQARNWAEADFIFNICGVSSFNNCATGIGGTMVGKESAGRYKDKVFLYYTSQGVVAK